MSQIQSSVGLITGIPIEDTVNQLMAVAARPRNLLQSRTDELKNEQLALDQVSSLLLGFRLSVTRMSSDSLFSATKANSSNSDVLSALVQNGATPSPGTYSFTPLQTASAQQLVSSSFSNLASQLGSGTLSLGFGGQVDSGIDLDQLNSGAGFNAGKIRITDRSGASAEIDLRAAKTIDDVVTAISSSGDIEVTASLDGDAIKLTDNSGGSGNLRVKEVGIGTTAASLGLDGINIAANEATGDDIFSLHSATFLSDLNHGAGVFLRDDVDDLTITLADESTLSIDLGDATTLGEVVEAINAADDTKLTASISSDGNRLELTDLTAGAGTFAVESAGESTAAEDLGLTTTAVGGVITGRRLIAGLGDTLVSSLNGGSGYEQLGSIDIVDRDGNPVVNVDLSSAETLGEIVTLINDSDANVTASINSARNGILIEDTSGGTGNLTITNGDATNTADALGLAIDDAVESVNSGSLNRQTISETTLLSTLNGGRGVSLGSIKITDSSGASSTIKLNPSGNVAETVGDVIDFINAASVDVEASINATGDGILLVDKAEGSGTLAVAEVNNGTTAADLHILGSSDSTNDSDEQIIDGTTHLELDLSTIETENSVLLSSLNNGNGISLGIFQVTDSAGNVGVVDLGDSSDPAVTIGDVIDKINATGVGVTASLNSTGSGILLTDTAAGDETLTVTDLGSGKSAAQLNLAGEATTSDDVQTINGLGLFPTFDENQSALQVVAEEINSKKLGFTASTFFDGAGYRLSITADNAGSANQLVFDTSDVNFSLNEVTQAKDAVLQLGGSASGGVILTSDSNTFDGVLSGVELTIQSASNSPVDIKIQADNSSFVSAVDNFVTSYNSLRTTYEALTSFDAETLSTGLLFGRNEAVRIDTDLGALLSGSFSASSDYRSLESIGVSLGDDGKLTLNRTKLTAQFENNPTEVKRLFSTETSGVVDRFTEAIDRLAGDDNSLFAVRYDSLNATIEANEARILRMDESLERERDRTLLEFYRLEDTVARLQANYSALESFQSIAPLSFQNNSN